MILLNYLDYLVTQYHKFCYLLYPYHIFISLAISVSKLSSEYEMAVITAFGVNPIKIIKLFLPITLVGVYSVY